MWSYNREGLVCLEGTLPPWFLATPGQWLRGQGPGDGAWGWGKGRCDYHKIHDPLRKIALRAES